MRWQGVSGAARCMHGSGSDDGLASGLANARTNDEALVAECAVSHAAYVVDEVAQFFLDRSGTWLTAALSTGRGDEMLELVFE